MIRPVSHKEQRNVRLMGTVLLMFRVQVLSLLVWNESSATE